VFVVAEIVEIFGEVEWRYMRSEFWKAGEEREYMD